MYPVDQPVRAGCGFYYFYGHVKNHNQTLGTYRFFMRRGGGGLKIFWWGAHFFSNLKRGVTFFFRF